VAHSEGDRLAVLGLPAEMLAHLRSLSARDVARTLPVFPSALITDGERPGTLQAMSGSYDVSAAEVRFIPRYPFLAGTSYTMFVGDGDALVIERAPVVGEASTEVVGVHPTAEVLPRNALRFYIHFSAPMTYGHAARHVHLERADTGEPLVGAFSPMDPELWDLGRRRLTVLLDPARIKRGLVPHNEIGYPLEEGTTVNLVVGQDFPDAAGRRLVREFRQSFGVGPDIRRRIDPVNWTLSLPEVGGTGPLIAHFDRPLDWALLERCLMVAGPSWRTITGIASVPRGDESWSFVPDSVWGPGLHHLLVDPVLEDLAGNSATRVFDRDLDLAEHEPRGSATQSIPFVPRERHQGAQQA
jgi:hypothetical protein